MPFLKYSPFSSQFQMSSGHEIELEEQILAVVIKLQNSSCQHCNKESVASVAEICLRELI
jgi:hypothetical protein